jgi:hypothetical protein
MTNQINFIRINNDVNGNPRYVCSWLNFNTETYEEALLVAKSLGGRKFNNKQYGGGILFRSVYNVKNLEKKILEKVA